MTDLIKQSSEADFQTDVLDADLPVLVDYWAPWCGPCKAIAPVIEDIAKEYEGKLKVVKVDVEAHPEVAAKFGIRGIPTLKVFKNGEDAATKVGSVNKAELSKFVEEAIS